MWEAYKEKLKEAKTLDVLEALRLELFGKKGIVTEELKKLGALPEDQRKEKGQTINLIRNELMEIFTQRKTVIEEEVIEQTIQKERVDVTLDARKLTPSNTQHPLTQTMLKIQSFFLSRGFEVKTGPEIEDEFHNFDALNIPSHHPARQSMDTFFVGDKVLRTHTSNVQIRTMAKEKPPLRVISIGRVYRNDHDATHSPMFHQIEGFVIEKDIHMGHLKGILLDFYRDLFDDPNIEVRFRPSYFPFTEPSAEIDVKLKGSWLELGGCGMIHPNVLKNCNIDKDEHQGFAFGLGIERTAMIRYGITDLRLFYENNIGFLKCF